MKHFVTIITAVIILFSCSKEDEISYNGKLDFSNDTITFDTVFASIEALLKPNYLQ